MAKGLDYRLRSVSYEGGQLLKIVFSSRYAFQDLAKHANICFHEVLS